MSDELNKAKDTEPVEVPKREWKECKLGDELELLYGKSLKESERKEGNFPVYGSNGIVGYHNEYLVKAPGIIVGRKGSVGEIKYSNKDFFPIDTTYYINLKSDHDIKFFYYFLLTLQLNEMNSHSAVPGLNRNDVYGINVLLPPLPEQKAIAGVLSSLDDKIDLLHRQNKTLEAMAETLFRQWFIEEMDEGWEVGCLGDVIEIFDSKRVPLSKMQRDKMKDGILYPYYGAATIMDYINDYIFDGEYILLGEDGTVRTEEGYPIMQYATGKFWVNNHTHVLQAKEPYNNFFIWNYLIKKNIDEIVTGAVQPKINQSNLKSIDFPKYPVSLVEHFNSITKYMFKKINQSKTQIRTLEKLRDTLLPKLMSGEIRLNLDWKD